MIQIRPDQYDRFRDQATADFERRAVAHLRAHAAEQWADAPEPAVRAFVQESRRVAARYGLTTEQAVVCVAHVRSLIGDRYTTDPRWDWVPKMWADDKYPPGVRAQLALQCTLDFVAAQRG